MASSGAPILPIPLDPLVSDPKDLCVCDLLPSPTEAEQRIHGLFVPPYEAAVGSGLEFQDRPGTPKEAERSFHRGSQLQCTRAALA